MKKSNHEFLRQSFEKFREHLPGEFLKKSLKNFVNKFMDENLQKSMNDENESNPKEFLEFWNFA